MRVLFVKASSGTGLCCFLSNRCWDINYSLFITGTLSGTRSKVTLMRRLYIYIYIYSRAFSVSWWIKFDTFSNIVARILTGERIHFKYGPSTHVVHREREKEMMSELCALKNNTIHFYLIIKFYFHIHNFCRYILLFKCGMWCRLYRKIMLMVKEPKTGSNDFS